MLIMGFGPRKPKDLGEVAPALCPNCGNHVVFRLLEMRNWFSVFFVPLVPGKARHVVICPVCQYGIELGADQLASARLLVERTARNGDASTDAGYRAAVDAFWTGLGGERLADVRDAHPASPADSPNQREASAEPVDESPRAAPPPATPPLPGPPPGWYVDPFDESAQRYWDGQRWTAGTNPPMFKA